MKPAGPLTFAIVGMGSAGRKHFAAIRRLFPNATIAGVSASRPALDTITYVADCAAAAALRPDFAIVASPAPNHLDDARPFVEAGIPTLIEKPMGVAVDEIERFLESDARAAVGIGYVLRQSSCLKAVKGALDVGAIGRVLYAELAVGMNLADWRPGTDPANGVSANARSGGGALLELSHEIDLARWLFGTCASLHARTSRMGGLTVDVEDYALIAGTFANNAEVSLHLDMLARPGFRSGRIVGAGGQIRYDLTARPARAEVSDGGPWRVLAEDAATLSELFERQLIAFVSAEGRHALASTEDGRAIAAFIAAARRSAAERRTIDMEIAA
ncbi:MAG: Gfo/Idh/MocA family oxidoreductase [Proteobacteria bacterium]|nr:Gfo/Idh/MocA family oxidoreductase [Pseudomonadota bacterium]